MYIDSVSENILLIALYLEKLIPGTVSEVWVDKDLLTRLKNNLPNKVGVGELINKTKILIEKLEESRRQQYLKEILKSLEFQIINIGKTIPYEQISENTFGFKITRISESEVLEIENNIRDLESKIGLSRQEVFIRNLINPEDYKSVFEKYALMIRSKLPKSILNYEDRGFEVETTTNQPWSAFNSHIAPFKSKLTLNTDIKFNSFQLLRLACHEAYGGHHSELSNKDKLLVKNGFGEHGLVITLSPQTFISESIAEGMYVLLGILNDTSLQVQMIWQYDRLTFALQNLATFLFNDDGKSRDEIKNILNKYYVSEDTLNQIINFSTDEVYGKYAPVYYSAYYFIIDLYKKNTNKEVLTKILFNLPCTPSILI